MRDFRGVGNGEVAFGFESLRKALAHPKYAPQRQRALAYWALPIDRGLPLAFLGRTLQDVLDTPFEELSNTPGIGHKKMATLLTLLKRALDDKPPPIERDGDHRFSIGIRGGIPRFDSAVVSEAHWELWRATVREHKVGDQYIGRLAPTLQDIPTVMWRTPLGDYLDYSLAEIRQLKTHGEKRLRVILEVYFAVYQVLTQPRAASHLNSDLEPKFLIPIERWFQKVAKAKNAPTVEEVRKNVALPLLAQVRVDCGPVVARLAEDRIGLNGPVMLVRAQSRKMGVTRARVYQLLEECEAAMQTRWPEGAARIKEIMVKFRDQIPTPDGVRVLQVVADLFYPDAATPYRRHGDFAFQID